MTDVTRVPPRQGEGAHRRPRPSGAAVAPAPLDASLGATWQADLRAGMVVALVALPLCLGIALASGAPLLAGLVTGAVGGLVVSRLSGSQLMVSGPAAGLTAIVASAILELGSFPAFLTAVVLGGLGQIALSALRAGIIAYFFPSAVIKGMLAAIGLTLILTQIPYALGAGIEPGGAVDGEGGGRLGAIATALGNPGLGALAIALAGLATLVAWNHPRLARAKALVPAPLVVVGLGVALSMAFAAAGSGLAVPREAFVNLPPLAEVPSMLAFPDWSQVTSPAVLTVAVTLTLVASLETLLSLEATDKLDPWRRTSSANRELMAQGVGNMTAGLVGGLPMTGVIVRSAVNVDAGGRTWRSSFVHGVLLVAAVALLAGALNRIPLAALAAILIHTGYKLAHPSVVRQICRAGAKCWVPFAVTVVAILLTDLLIGIGIGLAVGAFFVLMESYNHAYVYSRDESADHTEITLRLAEEVSFLNKVRIKETLSDLPAGSVVTVDGRMSRYIDPDVVELLHEHVEKARLNRITMRLVGIPAPVPASTAH